MSDLRSAVVLLFLLFLAGCSGGQGSAATCNGTVLVVEGDGATLPQLMAHATAMGMTREEAETLLYLEGITPQAILPAGREVCLDGKPD